MKVLVSGGAGFVGSFVVEFLIEHGFEVAVLDVKKPIASAQWYECDLLDGFALRDALVGMDAVVHLAAQGDVYEVLRNPVLASRVNSEGTLNIVLASQRAGVPRFVYASTWEVYGPPVYQPVDERHPCAPDHPYSISKLAGEQLCRFYGRTSNVKVISLRLGTAYGPRMRSTTVFSRFVAEGARGNALKVQGTGAQFRQFTHARDIAAAFGKALQYDGPHDVFNICSDEVTTILSLAETVARRFAVPIVREPARAAEPQSILVSSRLAHETMGWSPRENFALAIDETIRDQQSRLAQSMVDIPNPLTELKE